MNEIIKTIFKTVFAFVIIYVVMGYFIQNKQTQSSSSTNLTYASETVEAVSIEIPVEPEKPKGFDPVLLENAINCIGELVTCSYDYTYGDTISGENAHLYKIEFKNTASQAYAEIRGRIKYGIDTRYIDVEAAEDGSLIVSYPNTSVISNEIFFDTFRITSINNNVLSNAQSVYANVLTKFTNELYWIKQSGQREAENRNIRSRANANAEVELSRIITKICGDEQKVIFNKR